MDLKRNTDFFNVPLLPVPSNFFSEVARSSIACQRLICAAQLRSKDQKSVEDLVESLTSGMHLNPTCRTDGNNLTLDEAFVTSALAGAGLSAAEAVSFVFFVVR